MKKNSGVLNKTIAGQLYIVPVDLIGSLESTLAWDVDIRAILFSETTKHIALRLDAENKEVPRFRLTVKIAGVCKQ